MALASIVWFVHRLSLDYSSDFQYEVMVQANMDGYAPQALASDILLIRGRASGFYMLKSRAKHQVAPMTIQVLPKEMKLSSLSDHLFAVAALPLQERIAEQLEGVVKVEAVLVDSIHVSLKKMATKKCKVVFNGSITYQPQYTSFTQVRLSPDSVTVSGLESALLHIDSIMTAPVSLKHLDRDMQGVVPLMFGDDFFGSAKEVRYEVRVARYTERTLTREVTVVNQPAGMPVLLLPSQVTIRFWAPYDTPDDYYQNYFRPVVPYSAIENSVGGALIPELNQHPVAVSHVSIDPSVIECIIQKRI
jgi:hypothetical protein